MDTVKLFRALIIAMPICMAGVVVSILFEPGPPESITNWFFENSGGIFDTRHFPDSVTLLATLVLLGSVFLIAWMTSLIGMLYLRPWARKLFIVTTLSGHLLMPFTGMSWSTPFENTFIALIYTFEGAILVMLFLEPIRGEFERRRSAHG